MRTTIEIPEELVKKAQTILKTETKTETIIQALKHVIESNERQKLILFRGKIDLDMDLHALRSR